jgi:hypothetical protein
MTTLTLTLSTQQGSGQYIDRIDGLVCLSEYRMIRVGSHGYDWVLCHAATGNAVTDPTVIGRFVTDFLTEDFDDVLTIR